VLPVSEETRQGLAVVQLPDRAAWEQWLQEHHDSAAGVWLKFAKKGTGVRTVVYAEALQSALCFGWIDGQVARYDDIFYLQRFTPRKKRSKWSQINVKHATRLMEEGRMRPSGLAQVQAAQADGRWAQAYAPQSQAVVPDDLQASLDAHPAAAAFFATLSGSTRYAFLHRLHHVTRPESRAKRIAGYIERLNACKTLED
jgi:uncharacterized protein YdeI (YjbR/CyaY-like superfamily)